MARNDGHSKRRSRNHGNPGPTTKHRKHQRERDAARKDGHDIRQDIARMSKRAIELAKLHDSVGILVRQSGIHAMINQCTPNLDMELFRDYYEKLLDQFFRLEKQITQDVDEGVWKHDTELFVISRALCVQRSAELLEGQFRLRYTGISIDYDGASLHFDLTEKGVDACAVIVRCLEKTEDARQGQICDLVNSGEYESYKAAEQTVFRIASDKNFAELSRRNLSLTSSYREVGNLC